MIRRLTVREGEPIMVDAGTSASIRRRLADLEAELRPRLSFVGGGAEVLTIRNLVGTVQVSPNFVLEVEPKTEPGKDWARALLDLMVSERASFEVSSPSAELTGRASLPEALARIYADQLGRAVRQEGPLLLLSRLEVTKSLLSGRLDVTAWVRERVLRPHKFPQQRTVLTAENEYTAAMAWVAEALAARCSSPLVRSHLRTLARDIRPGLPDHRIVDQNVATKDIPPQWKAYEPAWATAQAVLRRLSPLHRSGVIEGLSLAIEPWPLLETLLHRALGNAAAQGRAEGWDLHASPHTSHPLLNRVPPKSPTNLSRIHTARSVEPDGLMREGTRVVATFEAKYTLPTRRSSRDHFFQAMTTAAALGAPLAVIVYPEPSEPVVWAAARRGYAPSAVAAIGLDMYGYARGVGDVERGTQLLAMLAMNAPRGTPTT